MTAASSRASSTESARCSGCHLLGSISAEAARRLASITRSSADQENGHSSTGRDSWKARSPSPIAFTASSGSARHRSLTAVSPGIADVTNQLPASSLPCSSTRGTCVNPTAQDKRAASAPKPSPLEVGAHFTKKSSGPPTSKVRPPKPFSQTARTGRPRARALTAAGSSTALLGGPASISVSVASSGRPPASGRNDRCCVSSIWLRGVNPSMGAAVAGRAARRSSLAA